MAETHLSGRASTTRSILVEGVGRQFPPTQEVYAILNTPENGQFQYLSTDEFPIQGSVSFSTLQAIEVMKQLKNYISFSCISCNLKTLKLQNFSVEVAFRPLSKITFTPSSDGKILSFQPCFPVRSITHSQDTKNHNTRQIHFPVFFDERKIFKKLKNKTK